MRNQGDLMRLVQLGSAGHAAGCCNREDPPAPAARLRPVGGLGLSRPAFPSSSHVPCLLGDLPVISTRSCLGDAQRPVGSGQEPEPPRGETSAGGGGDG